MKNLLLLSAIALFSVINVGCAGHQYNVKTVKYVQQQSMFNNHPLMRMKPECLCFV